MTVNEDTQGLIAERRMEMDFSGYGVEVETDTVWTEHEKDMIVRDNYVISNEGGQDRTVTAVYPITGDFQTAKWPVIKVNEEEADWELYAGAYSGEFVGAGDELTSSVNLMSLNSWEGYGACWRILSAKAYIMKGFFI